jgi:hypothetical protein
MAGFGCAWRCLDDDYAQPAIGAPRVSAAIATFRLLLKIVDVFALLPSACSFYLAHDAVALCVDICINMMRDLPSGVTESH